MRILVLALGAVVALGVGTALGVAGHEGRFTVICDLSHRLSDDPIVHPHHHGDSHSHEFYGNHSTNAHSNLGNMRSAGTSCERPEDRSGYWIPTLYKFGRPVPASEMTVYYLGAGKDPGSIRAIPDGLQMIAGDADAKEIQDDDIVDWRCVNAQAFDDTVLGRGAAKRRLRKAKARVRALKVNEATGRKVRAARLRLREARLDLKPSSLPSCPPGKRILLDLRFPDCWDGQRLDSADHKSHMTTAEYSDGERRCPPSHPVPVPAINFSISWPIADGYGARLASGGVRTMHGDVFSAWDPGTQAGHVARCMNADVDCGSD